MSTTIRPGGPQRLGSLFAAAFTQSRNPMALLDNKRRHVDVNGAYVQMLGYSREELIGRPLYEFVVDGPRVSLTEWRELLAAGRFAGEADLYRKDGTRVGVQYAATGETVTGQSFVLAVVLTTSRWGARFRRPEGRDTVSSPLSRREIEVVALVAHGKTGIEIASELHISHDTVRTHVRNAMRKLHARSRAHLVAKALAEGWVLDLDG